MLLVWLRLQLTPAKPFLDAKYDFYVLVENERRPELSTTS